MQMLLKDANAGFSDNTRRDWAKMNCTRLSQDYNRIIAVEPARSDHYKAVGLREDFTTPQPLYATEFPLFSTEMNNNLWRSKSLFPSIEIFSSRRRLDDHIVVQNEKLNPRNSRQNLPTNSAVFKERFQAVVKEDMSFYIIIKNEFTQRCRKSRSKLEINRALTKQTVKMCATTSWLWAWVREKTFVSATAEWPRGNLDEWH